MLHRTKCCRTMTVALCQFTARDVDSRLAVLWRLHVAHRRRHRRSHDGGAAAHGCGVAADGGGLQPLAGGRNAGAVAAARQLHPVRRAGEVRLSTPTLKWGSSGCTAIWAGQQSLLTIQHMTT